MTTPSSPVPPDGDPDSNEPTSPRVEPVPADPLHGESTIPDPVNPEAAAPASPGRRDETPTPIAPESAPQDRRLPRDIWILISAAFVIALGYGLIAPILPQFANQFAISYGSAGLVISAFAAFRLLWATPTGSLVQRYGERRVYMSGVAIVAASSAATAFAQNYWQLLVFRSLGGIGSVMFTVAAVGMLVKLAPAHMRGKVSAAYGATFLIGNITGPVLGGLLAEISMQAPFLVYAGALVVAATLIGVFLPKPSAGAAAATVLPPMTFREAWADPAYRASLATGFANGWANFGVRVSVVPLFVAAMISDAATAAGIVMAAFAAGNAAMLPFSSRFADAVGRKPLIVVGAAVAGTFTILFGFAPNLAILVALSVLAGAGVGALNPAQQAALADVIGSKRSAGPVISTYQMMADVGAIAGPILGGVIADHLGFAWTFALTGAILVVFSIPWWRTGDTLHRAAD